MRRVTALCAAGFALSSLIAPSLITPSLAAPKPAQTGYYLIRWDNTGVCQVWNDGWSMKPLRWPADYEIVSKPFPAFTEAMAAKEAMRQRGRCTW